MDIHKFKIWLNAYGECWEAGDSEGITKLFSDDARYYETPFDEPMVGLAAIEQYWTDGAEQSQEQVKFSYSSANVSNLVGTCRWQTSFTRVPSGIKVELDGYLEATFNTYGRCTIFREWWHRKESES